MTDTKTNTSFLDLDSIVPPEVVVKLGGKEHKLSPITVEDFIANTKAIQDYAKGEQNLEGELELIIDMLLRAFPTMDREMLKKLSQPQLDALGAFAQQHNGSKKV